MEKAIFTKGTIYKAINFLDSRGNYDYKVIKRTAKTVTLQEMDGREINTCFSPITRKIKTDKNVEYCMDTQNIYITADSLK